MTMERTRSQVLWRLLRTVIAFIAFSIVRTLVALCILVQYILLLCTLQENKRLRVFYNHLAAYDYQLIRYMTLLADRPPFPFNDLPAPWDEVPEEVDLDGR